MDRPLATAVVFHSGSFDYIDQPEGGQPLAGQSLQEVTRLTAPFGIRMVFATLGMYPAPIEHDDHMGALPLAFAEEDVALVLPMNCWGDLWHDKPGTRENDFYADLFFRSGGAAAEWGWRLVAEDGFGDLLGVELPFEPDRNRLALVGLGEGGRAVGEVLAYGATPAAVVIEGHNDDLDAWSAAQPLVGPGLDRIFKPGDPPMERAFSSAPTLPPTLWIWSSLDPSLAAGSQDLVLPRLSPQEIVERDDTAHIAVNADADLAEQAVRFVLDAF
ncbi:MAG: hypothetical protein KC656_12285 [Myxococcales bacterium]|nr:hypothetical protein [Myxococcales bacterium]